MLGYIFLTIVVALLGEDFHIRHCFFIINTLDNSSNTASTSLYFLSLKNISCLELVLIVMLNPLYFSDELIILTPWCLALIYKALSRLLCFANDAWSIKSATRNNAENNLVSPFSFGTR